MEEHSLDNTSPSSDSSIEGRSKLDGYDDMAYDFSFLPEPVWVKVMEQLPLTDRYHLSTTCHALYDIFNHPSCWSSAKLWAYGSDNNFSMTYSFMVGKFKEIVDRFGHYFQRLTISFTGHLLKMQKDVREIVVHMSEVCRLEHLVLEIGVMTSEFHLFGFQPFQEDLKKVLLLVDTAFRLKKLEIVSWPMFPNVFENAELNIFEAMKRNGKLANLEFLNLFWMKNKQWSERNPLLPSPGYVASFLPHFQCLQGLALRSPMLSDELVQELASASRVKLLSLKILVSYGSARTLPTIASSSWAALVNKSPALQVEFAVMSLIPDAELSDMLKPEIPLCQIKLLQYARCSKVLLTSLTAKFKQSLCSFICYSDPTGCDLHLHQLVATCENMDEVVFHGQIHCRTLLRIVTMRKHWKQFDFLEKQILTESNELDYDPDAVLVQNPAGDLVMVDLVRFHGHETEEQRNERMDDLKAEVSKRMDYGWRPS